MFSPNIWSKGAKGVRHLLSTASVFALVFSGLSVNTASAQVADGGFAPYVLTSSTNTSLYVDIQALSFSGGKWSYKLSWRRTLDRPGSIYVSPKLDKSAAVPASCQNLVGTASTIQNSNVTRVGSCVVTLNPGTRYRLEFYKQPSAGGQLFLRKFFNTLDPSGNPVPMNRAIGGTAADGGLITSINPTTGAVTTVNPATGQSGSGTPIATATTSPTATVGYRTTPSGCKIADINDPSWHFPDLHRVDLSWDLSPCGAFMSVYFANPPEGLARPVEPQVGYENPHSQGWFAGNDPGANQYGSTMSYSQLTATSSPYRNGDYKEVHVYLTTGRKTVSSFYSVQADCTDPDLKKDFKLNLPAGVTYSGGCQQNVGSGRNNIFGILGGSPTQSGDFVSELRTTYKGQNALTKVFMHVIDHGSMQVSLKTTDGSNTVTNTASLGSRVAINVNQASNITTWNDIDFWAVPGSQSTSANPENFSNRIQLGRFTIDEGHQPCNNSTQGGGDAYAYGCARYVWLVGDSLGTNLAPGTYTIYAATHLPAIDKTGQYIARLYGNCQLGYRDALRGNGCNGFAWGGAPLTITAAEDGATLPTNGSGPSQVASYSMLRLTADTVINGQTSHSSIGQGGEDNGRVPGCTGGTDAGGVVCPGPNVNTAVKPGQSMDFSWKIETQNNCPNVYIHAGDPIPNTDCQVADIVSGTVIRPARMVPYGGAIQSSIYVTGPTITNLDPLSQQNIQLRRCTSGIVPGGFDTNPSQGYINGPTGTARITIPADCAGVLNGVTIVQEVNVYMSLNGGGSTYSTYMMGGMQFGNLSLNGINDADLSPNHAVAQITNLTCQSNNDSSSYNLTWDPFSGNFPDHLDIYYGTDQAQVQSSCPSGTNTAACQKRQVGGFGQGPQMNAPFRISPISPGTRYYNKVVAIATDANTPSPIVACQINASGAIDTSTAVTSDPFNSPTCVLPSQDSFEEQAGYHCGGMIPLDQGGQFNQFNVTYLIPSQWKFDRAIILYGTDPAAVAAGCPAGTSCRVVKDITAGAAMDAFRRSSSQLITGLTPDTQYTARIVLSCNGVQGYREATVACYTERR